MSADPSYSEAATEPAIGSRRAQDAIELVAAGRAPCETIYLRLAEVAGLYGWKSAAVRAFVLELAKRAGTR